MTTENQETEIQATEQVQLTDVEQRAMEMGWRPKSEFDGDEVDFVDAREFISRKPLYDKISQQSKQIKNVSKALDALKEHYTKVQVTEYERALKDLKTQRKEALVQGDADAFERAEDGIRQAEEQFNEIREAAQNIRVDTEPVLNPVFINWKNRNPWYENTSYMREFADEEGRRLHSQGLDPTEVLKRVEQAVRKEFPTKFRNPNKEGAPDVDTNRGTHSSSKGAKYQLSEQERNIMNTLVRSKVMTEEQYIADLKKAKGG